MKIDAATTELTEELGRDPDRGRALRAAGGLGGGGLEAIEAGHARRTLSLDAPRRTDGEDPGPAIEALPATESGYDRVEADLAASSADLDTREWEVLRMRFNEELTQSEIGDGSASRRCRSRVSAGARCWKLLGRRPGRGGHRRPAPPSARRGVRPCDCIARWLTIG